MKLQKEYNFVKYEFEKRKDKIKDYIPKLKASGEYKDFETRLIFDCLYAFIGSKKMCNWIDKYNCTTTHIKTLGKRVLKDLELI